MFEGYLEVGSGEVINDARTAGYAATVGCPVNWLVASPCPGIVDATGGTEAYDYAQISEAPWYDEDIEATHRFLGVQGLRVEGAPDSTREAKVSESIVDGGLVGQVRHATRRMRWEVMLTAVGQDALEAGFAWLSAALSPSMCSAHGDVCGVSDSSFFVDCPTPGITVAEYTELRRYVHAVTCVSGPTVVQKLHRGDAWGYVVEFVLVAGVPWLFGATRYVPTPPSLPIVVQDVPFNLVPYPSAELSTGTVIAATNYSDNPSVELNATNWAKGSTVVVAGDVTGAASTLLASAGTTSFRTRFVASNTSAVAGTITAENTSATFTAAVTGQRMSVNMWASALVESGTAVIQKTEVFAIWRAGASVLRTDLIGTVPAVGGGAVSLKAIAVPATTTNVIVQAKTTLSSWSTAAVVNLYGDAVAVTVP